MKLQRAEIGTAVLLAGLAALTVYLFAGGYGEAGVLVGLLTAAGAGGSVWAAVRRQAGNPPAAPGDVRGATVPPDGHLRFTLVVDGLEPDRLAAVWSDLGRPDRPPPEEVRLLYRTFSVLEGPRFRFRGGDPTATAALLRQVLETATGVPVRTTLEPAAERTPLWS